MGPSQPHQVLMAVLGRIGEEAAGWRATGPASRSPFKRDHPRGIDRYIDYFGGPRRRPRLSAARLAASERS
jgi:hypothetical protein